MRQYLTIKGKFTWRQLDKILGKSVYGLEHSTEKGKPPCGLAEGEQTYKIYNDHRDYSLGLKYPGTRSAHVVLHTDGICFSGSLSIDCDWDLAEELYEKVKSENHP